LYNILAKKHLFPLQTVLSESDELILINKCRDDHTRSDNQLPNHSWFSQEGLHRYQDKGTSQWRCHLKSFPQVSTFVCFLSFGCHLRLNLVTYESWPLVSLAPYHKISVQHSMSVNSFSIAFNCVILVQEIILVLIFILFSRFISYYYSTLVNNIILVFLILF